MNCGLPMANKKFLLQFLAIIGLLAQQFECLIPVDADVRARMEEKAVSSISLRSLEEMVEKRRYPVSPKLLLFQPKNHGLNDPTSNGAPIQESAFAIRYADPIDDYRSGGYYSLPAEEMDAAASHHMSLFHSPVSDYSDDLSYAPQWSHPTGSSYNDDLISSKSSRDLSWEDRDDAHPRQEQAGDDGCRTVVKKVPEEEGSGSRKVKSIIISKECEYPKGFGPDAHIPGADPVVQKSPEIILTDAPAHSRTGFGIETKQFGDSPLLTSDTKEEKTSKDPLAMDYIDKMFDTHFKNFPSFKFRIPSLDKHHQRFSETLTKLEDKDDSSEPETVRGYSNDGETLDEEPAPFVPPPQKSRYEITKPLSRKKFAHRPQDDEEVRVYRDESPVKKEELPERNYSNLKEGSEEESEDKKPKAMKKSFAYYRRDNPTGDPNNQEYAEEYAHGNYRSFSTSYDSDRDGPK